MYLSPTSHSTPYIGGKHREHKCGRGPGPDPAPRPNHVSLSPNFLSLSLYSIAGQKQDTNLPALRERKDNYYIALLYFVTLIGHKLGYLF